MQHKHTLHRLLQMSMQVLLMAMLVLLVQLVLSSQGPTLRN